MLIPVTQPTVSQQWREEKALTPASNPATFFFPAWQLSNTSTLNTVCTLAAYLQTEKKQYTQLAVRMWVVIVREQHDTLKSELLLPTTYQTSHIFSDKH